MAATQKGAASAAPEHHAMAPRVGEPDQEYVVTDARGLEHRVIADSDGTVRPRTTDEVRVADAHGLPTLSIQEA